MYIINTKISEIAQKQDLLEIENLANSIRNEIILATQVHDNYVRRFEIPLTLNGKKYSIKLLPEFGKKEVLEIKTDDRTETYDLPVKITGAFLEVKDDSLDYCVAKGREEISLSKNQLELSNNATNVSLNTPFSLYVKANCIENLQTAEFTIKFPENIKYIGARKAHNHEEVTEILSDIYGSAMFNGDEKDKSGKSINNAFFNIECENDCIVTISNSGQYGPSGSDYLVELVFEATKSGSYIVDITDPNLVDNKIRFVPPSTQGITIQVVS